MSRRLFSVPSFTPTATADNSALANGTYMAVGANSATQGIQVTEIFIQGAGTSSTNINNNVFARDLVLGATPTALAAPNRDGPQAGSLYTAPGTLPLTFTAATTGPSRSNTALTAQLVLTINALGGIARWKPADLSEAWWIVGQTVSVSESSLSASTATGTTSAAQSATIQYETLATAGLALFAGILAMVFSLGASVLGIA